MMEFPIPHKNFELFARILDNLVAHQCTSKAMYEKDASEINEIRDDNYWRCVTNNIFDYMSPTAYVDKGAKQGPKVIS